MKIDSKNPDQIVLPQGVLKIKKGFNPNSSSIGTVVYSFPLAFAGISALAAILTAWLTRDKDTVEPSLKDDNT